MTQDKNPIHPVRELNDSAVGVDKKVPLDGESPLMGNLRLTYFSNGVKKFFKDLLEKLDQKMLEKAKTKPCCAKSKPKDAS